MPPPLAPSQPPLPPGFMLGAASSAYQVEGAVDADGRGQCIWEAFSQRPGRILDGSNGHQACDSYHRVDDDLALLERLGVGSYRFSVSWARVQPTTSGQVNTLGLDYYDRLVDRLCSAGIEPMATLYHFDLPQWLEDDGGWLNRATIDRFTDYAAIVGERLADRVTHWVPINEPAVVTFAGYATGVHAPGRELMFEALPVAHHLLLAHGRGAGALRAAGAESIGCANNHSPMWPASDDAADVGATKIFDALWNGLFLEAMLLGRYPADLAPLFDDIIVPGDLADIRQPLDFYGVCYTQPLKIGATDEDADFPFERRPLLGYPETDYGWAVVPDALREWLISVRARFRAALPPIVITDASCSYGGDPDADGVIDDQARIDWHDSHLRAVAEATQRGVDIRGYFARSLLDGFEWSAGYSQRFGLVHVDHETLVRTPKRSFDWYAGLIASQSPSIG